MTPEDGDYSCPGLKKNAASWVGKDKSKFFLLYGHIDRQGWQLLGSCAMICMARGRFFVIGICGVGFERGEMCA